MSLLDILSSKGFTYALVSGKKDGPRPAYTISPALGSAAPISIDKTFIARIDRILDCKICNDEFMDCKDGDSEELSKLVSIYNSIAMHAFGRDKKVARSSLDKYVKTSREARDNISVKEATKKLLLDRHGISSTEVPDSTNRDIILRSAAGESAQEAIISSKELYQFNSIAESSFHKSRMDECIRGDVVGFVEVLKGFKKDFDNFLYHKRVNPTSSQSIDSFIEEREKAPQKGDFIKETFKAIEAIGFSFKYSRAERTITIFKGDDSTTFDTYYLCYLRHLKDFPDHQSKFYDCREGSAKDLELVIKEFSNFYGDTKKRLRKEGVDDGSVSRKRRRVLVDDDDSDIEAVDDKREDMDFIEDFEDDLTLEDFNSLLDKCFLDSFLIEQEPEKTITPTDYKRMKPPSASLAAAPD
jgi:hypothetical protein